MPRPECNQLAFMPWICHGGAAEPGEPPPITDVPLSSHITAAPVVVLTQRMSLLPSLLKSPVSAIVQGPATVPARPPPITEVPLSSHTTASPFVVLSHRMSLLPSPLKSPVPTIVHGLAAVPGSPPPVVLQLLVCPVPVHWTSQMTTAQVPVLYQRMSANPS